MSLHNNNLYDYLKNLNNKELSLPLDKIVRLSIDILTAIALLHGSKIIHRDIKSANIFVNHGMDGDISYLTIGDFDTAKTIIDGTKTCIGTTLWVAPEVLESKSNIESYSFPADIWSFGMVLYELMTCKLPYYEAKTQFIAIGKIINGELPFLDHYQITKFNPIIDLWGQCLNLDPSKRPTADKLLYLFENLMI